MPEERKSAILDLTDVGVRQKVVVQHYSMQQFTASSIIRRRNENGNNERTVKRGRMPKSTPRCIRSLLKYTSENIFKPLHVITARFDQFRAVPVCRRTVRRVLEKNIIKNYVAACKPYLTRDHQKIRMLWALHHQHWSNER